jgi:4,4'-diaponeurosporenoate glycosyltransferase
MIAPAALICALGIPAGFLLIRRIPVCPPAQPPQAISLSIVIPARNEENNIPRLLQSIKESAANPIEVLVVDDASTDSTARVARTLGASVVASAPLPSSWTGKTWACHQGALRATGGTLLFLDADTYFVAGGLDRTIAYWQRERDSRLVLSLLPYHVTHTVHEQLSLFFSILMAAGAGGFGVVAAPQLFGQSLLITKETYFAVGGHAGVRGFILENLYLAQLLRSTEAHIHCLGGRGALYMRMFPEGFRQMSDSWTKAFVHGAAASGGFILASAIIWISALWATVLLLITPHDYGRNSLAIVYILLALQLAWFARRLGSYRFITCLLYPLPLTYYCVIFGRSAIRRMLGRKTAWRGREI